MPSLAVIPGIYGTLANGGSEITKPNSGLNSTARVNANQVVALEPVTDYSVGNAAAGGSILISNGCRIITNTVGFSGYLTNQDVATVAALIDPQLT